MAPNASCKLCGFQAESGFSNPCFRFFREATHLICQHCGDYWISEIFGELQPEERWRIACIAFERHLKNPSPFVLTHETPSDEEAKGFPDLVFYNKDDLLSQFPEPSEIVPRSLQNISRLVKHPFENITLKKKMLALACFCDCSDTPGEHDAANVCLAMDDEGLIKILDQVGTTKNLMITAKGWQLVRRLKNTPSESTQAFVAMSFSESMNNFYSVGIEPAIKEAGYNPRRVDAIEHNNKICDEIIAEIRKSKFLFADFSGRCSGVYYEAGFAQGLGIPVIWAVIEKDLADCHFDTRQYNHIVYQNPEDLRTKLYNRICATILS